MKLGPITKVALAGGLLLGQAQPTDKFYEDDEDFNLTSAVLSRGWNWSINQAEAADECTNNENTSAEQCIEHIEVTTDQEAIDYDFYDMDTPTEVEPVEQQTSTSGPIPQHQTQELNEVIDCPSQVEQDFRSCKNKAKETYNSDNYICYKKYSTNNDAVNSCYSDVERNFDIDIDSCSVQRVEELLECP